MAIVASCFNPTIKKKLDAAESLIQLKPDSCLIILKSVDRDALITREEKARYALLMSAALDKNYIDVTSDSLIRIAVDYYSIKKDQWRRMMSHYYQGLFLNNAGDLTAAMVALEKAEKDALNLEDHLYAGLIFRTKGSIYNETINHQAAQSCFLEAISHFKYLDNPDYAAYAELGLAIIYFNSHNFSKAIQQLESVLAYNNDNINDYYSKLKASIMIQMGDDPYAAVRLFQSSPNTLFDLKDYCLYAIAMERILQRDSADMLMSKAYALCNCLEDSVSVDFMYADILHQRGEDNKAYLMTRKAAIIQDSLTRVLLQQSVSNAQRDYYKAESQLQEERVGRLRERNLLGTATAMLALLLLLGLTLFYRKRKEQEIKEQMLRISIAQSELQQAEQTNAQLLGSLFSERINNLDKISGDYVSAASDKERMAALKKFKAEIASMRTNEDLFISLETDLDRYCDGVMTKLKEQVPSIKGENRKLIALFFAGLPYSTVQLIMNSVSVGSLKTARSRFRKEIREANAPDEAMFLKLLELQSSRRKE